jgi:monofunctional biosynthetic peptidoglycan transglycosylase
MARARASSGPLAGFTAWLARLGRWAAWLVVVLVLLVVALTILWRVVPPVSTLMLGRWATLKPVTRVWAPLDAISPRLVEAVIASEDGKFCQHGGVDWDALQDVVTDEDGPSRGASTITMQVAKNLFLWPSRSYVRKGLEIPLALWLDLVWSKRRIVEVYLNIAEWGPGVFGAEAAARASFDKPASALTLHEAALMATSLPNPILRRAERPGRSQRRLAGIVSVRAAGIGPYIRCIAR